MQRLDENTQSRGEEDAEGAAYHHPHLCAQRTMRCQIVYLCEASPTNEEGTRTDKVRKTNENDLPEKVQFLLSVDGVGIVEWNCWNFRPNIQALGQSLDASHQ